VNQVFTTMGTVVSVRIDEAHDAHAERHAHADRRDHADVLAAIERAFADLDHEFSRWDPTSPASLIAAGMLSLTRASEEHRAVYAEAVQWRNDTGGAFDPHRADGSIDLAGIVKAVAIERAGEILDAAGLTAWCCNAGGDVLVRGRPSRAGDPPDDADDTADADADAGRAWTAGIVDPADAHHLLGTLDLADGPHRALATSGTSERGEHVWRTDGDAMFRQVSVVAPDIVTADVLATAILSGGRQTLDDAVRRWPIDVVAVTREGQVIEARTLVAR
jgi:FAD:protein FMN transferase